MNAVDRYLMIATIVVSILVGFLVGLSWRDYRPDEPWLYRYQTLAGGILAVFAAVVTVMEMRRTDERQQLRHDHLGYLTVFLEVATWALTRCTDKMVEMFPDKADARKGLDSKILARPEAQPSKA